jgi:phosphatidylserine/phosphatidylglycerophosphate/cardiolipin synthase-like enzyme
VVVDNEQAFVSSANCTEAAQTKNIEVGLYVRNRRTAQRLSDHFASLAAAGIVKPVPLELTR